MTSAERSELEGRAKRCVQRGELKEALEIYRALSLSFPEDAALARRIENLEENLQPAELLNAKASFTPEPQLEDRSEAPEAEGERLFAVGDLAGAMAAYRRALKEKPDSELIRERLEELFRLARARALPEDPPELLHALLERIAARRRV